MPRKSASITQSTGTTNTVQVVEDTSWDRVWANQVQKLLNLAPPWVSLGLLWLTAFGLHHMWPGNWLTAVGLAFCVTCFSGLICLITRSRGGIGQLHATFTPLGGGFWLVWCMYQAGPGGSAQFFLWLVFGGFMALSWNARFVVRSTTWLDQMGTGGDILSKLFSQRNEAAGMRGAMLRVLGDPNSDPDKPLSKLPFRIRLAPGDTQAGAIKGKDKFESAHGLPPGATVLTPNLDRADDVDGVLTDPRRIREFQMWPGPSIPSGGSMADPLRTGIWQTGEDQLWLFFRTHFQIMGMTGAGKSTMAAWSILAEIITRRDAATFGIDLSKGEQTLGPFLPALNYFADTKAKARALLDWLDAQVIVRTNDLGAQGLQRWQKGAKTATGEDMPLYIIWCEEFAKFYQILTDAQQERWLNQLKEARTAGILWVPSLQRSDWSQMPTLARGQLGHICMGVESSADASFGLSEMQEDAGVHPEHWQNNEPGMAFMDVVGLPKDKRTMPGRFYSWGEDSSMIKAHVAQYPLSTRIPLPTAAAMSLAAATGSVATTPGTGGAVDPGEIDDDAQEAAELAGQVNEEIGSVIDADPDGWDAATAADRNEQEDDQMPVNADVPLDPVDPADDFDFNATVAKAPEMDAAEAMQTLTDHIAGWHEQGRREFDATELVDLLVDEIGKQRTWLYWALGKLADRGMIERTNERSSSWAILSGIRPVGAPAGGADSTRAQGGGFGGRFPGHDVVSGPDKPTDTAADSR